MVSDIWEIVQRPGDGSEKDMTARAVNPKERFTNSPSPHEGLMKPAIDAMAAHENMPI